MKKHLRTFVPALLLCGLLYGCGAPASTSIAPQSESMLLPEPEPVVSAVEAVVAPEPEPEPGPAFGGAALNADNLRLIDNMSYVTSFNNGAVEYKAYEDGSMDFFYIDFATRQRQPVGFGEKEDPATQGALLYNSGGTGLFAADGAVYAVNSGVTSYHNSTWDERELAGVRKIEAGSQPVCLPKDEIFHHSQMLWDGERLIAITYTKPDEIPIFSLTSLNPATGAVERLAEFGEDGYRYTILGLHPEGLLLEQSEAEYEEPEAGGFPLLKSEQNRTVLLFATGEDKVTELTSYYGWGGKYTPSSGGLYHFDDDKLWFQSWSSTGLAAPAEIPLPEGTLWGDYHTIYGIYGMWLEFATHDEETSLLYSLNLGTGEVLEVPKKRNSGGYYTEAFIIGGNDESFLLVVGEKGYMGTENIYALCGQDGYWTGEGEYLPVAESDTILPIEDITID